MTPRLRRRPTPRPPGRWWTAPAGPSPVWGGLIALAFVQVGYPLTSGAARAGLVVVTVLLGYAASVGHAAMTRGTRAALTLVTVTTGGGFAVEALGVATGIPFGAYGYSATLGPQLFGVPLVIPLAWTWLAWPAWLAAGRLTAQDGRAGRVALAGLGLAAWDLFLDPQMVSEGYWRWVDPGPALPGVPAVPLSNYLGWLVVATGMMALLAVAGGSATRRTAGQAATGRAVPRHRSSPAVTDAPMLALYLWTYAASVLAHAAFLDLPASAGWGALGMGTVALPLAVRLVRGTCSG